MNRKIYASLQSKCKLTKSYGNKFFMSPNSDQLKKFFFAQFILYLLYYIYYIIPLLEENVIS